MIPWGFKVQLEITISLSALGDCTLIFNTGMDIHFVDRQLLFSSGLTNNFESYARHAHFV